MASVRNLAHISCKPRNQMFTRNIWFITQGQGTLCWPTTYAKRIIIKYNQKLCVSRATIVGLCEFRRWLTLSFWVLAILLLWPQAYRSIWFMIIMKCHRATWHAQQSTCGPLLLLLLLSWLWCSVAGRDCNTKNAARPELPHNKCCRSSSQSTWHRK